MLYEAGVSPFQLRVLLLIWFNSLAKACSMEANPFECFVVLTIAFWPVFDYFDAKMVSDAERGNQRD